MAILLLAGCASQPAETPRQQPTADTQQPDEPLIIDRGPYDFLQQAEDATRGSAQQYDYLLRASESFFTQGAWQHGAAVLSQLEDVNLPANLQTTYWLQRAQLLLYFEQYQSATAALAEIGSPSNREQRIALLQLHYQIYSGQERYLSAARQLVELDTYDDTDHTDAIWDYLSKVPAGYWRQNVRENDENMRGWSSLFTRITQALDYREPVGPTLERWQHQFSRHPAARKVAELLETQPWVNEQPRRIAVLLPMSGQFSAQGQAVRDGVLAALSNERNEDVLFIDTTSTNADDVIAVLERENIEAVIGPLSRDYVDRLAQTLTSRESSRAWVHLWLNRAPDNFDPGLDSFFALDIDTEVGSAVDYLSAEEHSRVLVLGTDTQRGRQLSQQFEVQWRDRHGPGSSSSGRYRSSNDMPDIVAEQLHVRDSNTRIELIERAMGSEELHKEPRSRQDISAIYLLGDAAQARLLKPFIETNISPFATRLPVFASSSVHEADANRGRGDLDGLIFSDAPWLLPGHPQADLLERFNRLRSNLTPPTQRLIAMGYDAMELLPRLSTMNWFSGYDHPGLTGQLRIEQHNIQRQLHWARIQNNQLVEQATHEHSYNRDSL